MGKESQYTKWKIITGYVFIVLLSLLAAVLIYKQMNRLVAEEKGSGNANEKLFIIGNTMTGLYEAEALSSAFAQTGNRTYFQEFLNILRETGKGIDTLKALSTTASQQIRMDSIRILLAAKIKNLQELVKVKQSYAPEKAYSQAIASITEKDTSSTYIRERVITQIDTTYIPTHKVVKRWIFSKIENDST
ncbi:MAG: histidine kinase, partial [Odoribacter sp.]|nr:histidine kinase [Odoribacter sp.]